jgi:hypothetical protein
MLVLVASCGTGKAAVEQAVLFSAVEGRVLKDGQPLAGATLVREWDFAEDRVRASDTVTTDANGRFRFAPVLHAYRKSRFLAQQPVVSQLIRVKANGQEWRVWVASKHDLKAGTEAASGPADGTDPDVPVQVTIDLDSPRAVRGKVLGHTLFRDAP